MIEIRPANLRDASWITANLRPGDRAEVYCQIPGSTTNAELAAWLLSTSTAFIAYVHDRPVMLFGTAPMTVCCFSVWAIGTPRMTRAIRAVSAFLLDEHIPTLLDNGFNNAEARSLATHRTAHRWLEALGGRRHGPPYLFGRGGEEFVTYRWTVADYRSIDRSKWSRNSDVPS